MVLNDVIGFGLNLLILVVKASLNILFIPGVLLWVLLRNPIHISSVINLLWLLNVSHALVGSMIVKSTYSITRCCKTVVILSAVYSSIYRLPLLLQ